MFQNSFNYDTFYHKNSASIFQTLQNETFKKQKYSVFEFLILNVFMSSAEKMFQKWLKYATFYHKMKL